MPLQRHPPQQPAAECTTPEAAAPPERRCGRRKQRSSPAPKPTHAVPWEIVFHTHRAAASVNISSQGQQIPSRQHGDGFFPHRPGRLFEIQRLFHRDIKYIVCPGRAFCHQRFEHSLRRHAQKGRHRHTVYCLPFRVRIAVGRIRDALLVQNTHDVGFRSCRFAIVFLTSAYAPPHPGTPRRQWKQNRCPPPQK